MIFCDKLVLDAKPRTTSSGYLVATPKAARTGIQEYAGFEFGRDEMKVVRVWRPEDEVFNDDALASFAHKPVTVDHPPVLVDAENWRTYSRGTTGGEVLREGEFLRVPMMLADRDAVKAVLDGKAELSMGYTCDIDWTPGVTPEGQVYDAVQRNIRGNHLAVVDQARGGPNLSIMDHTRKDDMTTRKVTVDGISVEVPEHAEQVISKFMKDAKDEEERLQEQLDKAKDQVKELQGKLDQMNKDKESTDAKVETLTKQLEDSKLTPERLDAAVTERSKVVDAAKRVCPHVTTDGKSLPEIKKEAVMHRMGDSAKDWNEAKIDASFDTLTEISGTGGQSPNLQVVPSNSQTASDQAYDKHKQWLASAYKGGK